MTNKHDSETAICLEKKCKPWVKETKKVLKRDTKD